MRRLAGATIPEDEKKNKKMTLQNELVQLQTEYAEALQEQNDSSSSSSSSSNGNTSSTAYGGAG